MVEDWTEGTWDGDRPVIPPHGDFVWYYCDHKWACVDACLISSLDLALRTVHEYLREHDPDAPPPRWWWLPIGPPPAAPEGTFHAARTVSPDAKRAARGGDGFCARHGLLGETGDCQDCRDAEVYGPFVCRLGHELLGPTDDCGQIWCSTCGEYMNPKDPQKDLE